MEIPYIFNIQKFSLHDGPGIRTTVFFKGCPLRCQWCHNPESQRFVQEMSGDQIVGCQYDMGELLHILKKDILFYDQSGGGVTLSGGEVMCQDIDYVVEIAKNLQQEGISVVVDTCGYAPTKNFAKIVPYTELFLYDLKLMDDKKHQHYTGVSNEQILKNLKFLSEQGAQVQLRLIMVKDVNMSWEDIGSLAGWLCREQIKVSGITLLPYHDFGKDKYAKLSRECTQNFTKPSTEDLMGVQKLLESYGFEVDV